MKRVSFIIMASLLMATSLMASTVERVEPQSWWAGMKTPLQIMLYGKDLSGYKARFVEPQLSVTGVHNAESRNYLFVDVAIADDAPAGNYTLVLERGDERLTVSYPIARRRAGSAERSSFGPQDMVYLLMPDRFANGDRSNDSTSDTAEKADRANLHSRHGGDIKGITDRLDYMAELGVTALWSTPLLLDDEPAYSYHGYACADYYKIDPRYGSNEEYFSMVEKAHERGIKVIMDVVTNHCGLAHWWMTDLPFAAWLHPESRTNSIFSTALDVNASQHDRDACNLGWFDAPMPDMAIEHPFLLQYFKQVFVWWVERADLDGLRVDTYPYNDLKAISQWTAAVREEYPNLNIVGECWTSSPAMVAYWDGNTPNRDGYNTNLASVMDFPLQESIAGGLANRNPGWGEGMMKVYNSLAHDFLYEDPRTLMIFLDNHDTDRFADVVKGDTALMKLGLTMLATMRGVPQLYYGTEFMFRSADMSQGHGGARVDFRGGWRGDKRSLFTKSGRSAKEQELFEFTKQLFNWRKGESVIHNGRTTHFIPTENTYVYFRYDADTAVMVVINASDKEHSIDWAKYGEITENYAVSGRDVISDEVIEVGNRLMIPAKSSKIIKFTKQ